jgi:hypothetical protein
LWVWSLHLMSKVAHHMKWWSIFWNCIRYSKGTHSTSHNSSAMHIASPGRERREEIESLTSGAIHLTGTLLLDEEM